MPWKVVIIFFDSHIHLNTDSYADQLSAHLIKARQNNIQNWLIPATDRASFDAIKSLCKDETGCYPAFGLHPYFIGQHIDNDLHILETYLEGSVAIGECGLDLMMDQPQFEKQLRFLKRQLDYANNLKLPLIIHARKTLDLILKELRPYKGLKGVVHSFSGSLQQAKQLIDCGFMLGFGGAFTYPRAKKLRSILQTIPEEFILIETDGPYQPSIFVKNGLHEPKDLLLIAKEVAKIRNESLERIADITTNNTKRLLKL